MPSKYNIEQKANSIARAKEMLNYVGTRIGKVKQKVFEADGTHKVITVSKEFPTKYSAAHIIDICGLSRAEAIEHGVMPKPVRTELQMIQELMSRAGFRKHKENKRLRRAAIANAKRRAKVSVETSQQENGDESQELQALPTT